MVRILLVFTVLAFTFSSCDKKSEGSSSAQVAKLIDMDVAKRYNQLTSKSFEKIQMFESRMAEMLMMMNAEMIGNCPEAMNKYQSLINAQSDLIQMKATFDMERFNFSNQLMTMAAEAVSKEDLVSKIEESVAGIERSSNLYSEAYIRLLLAMDEANIQSPLIDELLSESSGAPVPPEQD